MAVQQTAQIAPAGTWAIDPVHSSVEFHVKHLMIATVRGRFHDFEGALEGGEEPRAALTVRTASIDTHEEQRDNHLRSPDFFDAETYPEIRFESSRIERVGDGYRIVGDLTLKDVTREVELAAQQTGTGPDPWGNERVGLEIRGQIDRRDFGLTWNQVLEAGGFVVGDTVKIEIDLSLVKQEG